MNELILSIIGVLLAGFSGYFGKLFGKLLKEKIGEIKHSNLQHAAWIAVRAVENIFTGKGEGDKKLNSAMSYLEVNFPWASKLKLRTFIETEVKALNSELGNEERPLTM